MLGYIRALTVGVKAAAWVSDTGSELNCVDRVVFFLPAESNGEVKGKRKIEKELSSLYRNRNKSNSEHHGKHKIPALPSHPEQHPEINVYNSQPA